MTQLPGDGKTILLIEDEFLLRQTMQEALELDGYSVWTAENGREGLHVLAQRPSPSLIVVDLVMPVMGGMAFLQRIAADTVMARIPVMVVSATVEQSSMRGVKYAMRKPPDLELLLALVKRYCTPAAGPN